LLHPTVIRDAIGNIAALMTRTADISTCDPYKNEQSVQAILHSTQPRFPSQQVSVEHEGVTFYAWCKLVAMAQTLSSRGGIGSYAVLQDGSTFSSEAELVMKLHGRGCQKCVSYNGTREEGLAIVRDNGKTFFFTSGVDLVVVFASHIELSTYHRMLRRRP